VVYAAQAAGWRELPESWQLAGDFNRVQLSIALDNLRDMISVQTAMNLEQSLGKSVSGPLGR
jgi:hypothetical protein